MPYFSSSSWLGAISCRQACHQHSMTRKAGLHKWKEFQGLPETQRERCVLIPNVNVCLSNFSSDLPSLPSPSSVWILSSQTVLSALPMESRRMRLPTFPPHLLPVPPVGLHCGPSLSAVRGRIQPYCPFPSPTLLLQK